MNAMLNICGDCWTEMEIGEKVEIARCYKCLVLGCQRAMGEESGRGPCCFDKKACELRESDQMATTKFRL